MATGALRPGRTKLLAILVAALGLQAGAPRAHDPGGLGSPATGEASAILPVHRAEHEIILLQVRLRGRLLADSLPAYPFPGGTLVPLGELCALLELNIRVAPRSGRAEGFVIQPSRPFRLDASAGSVTVLGRMESFPAKSVEVHPEEIYIDSSLFSEWFPVDLKVDGNAALLELKPREMLPVEERWAREDRVVQTPEDPRLRFQGYRPASLPYAAWDAPWMDLSLASQFRQVAGAGQRSSLPSAQAFLGGDLLWMSAQGYASLQDPGGLRESRFSLARRDPDGGLLGPLAAREVILGDTLSPGVGLASGSSVGPGLLVSNFPIDSLNTMDKRSFAGELPPGWQVELYQNGNLIAFQASPANRRYDFPDIPLQFGTNDFRLVFYGPGGERREEVVQVNLKELRPKQGEFRYRLAGVDPRHAPRRVGVEGEYGLGDRFVVQGSALSLDLLGIDQKPSILGQQPYTHGYLQAGLRGYWDRAVGRLLLAADERNGGRAGYLGLDLGLAGGHTLSFNHTQLANFASEVYLPQFGAVRSRSFVTFYGALPDSRRPWGGYEFNFQYDQLAQGGSYSRLANRLSVSIQGLTLTNGLQIYQLHNLQGQDSRQTNGTFMASRNFGSWGLRGQGNYTLTGGALRLNDTSLYLDTFAFQPIQLQAGITRSATSGSISYLLNAFRYTGKFSLGLNCSFTAQSRFQAGLTLHVGLTRNPATGAWRARSESAVGFGGVLAQAYEDRNGNGRRDPGEPWIENPAFTVSGSGSQTAQGLAYFNDRLPGDRVAYIGLQESSLEDPHARPSVPGYRLLPRSGRVARLEFPVVNYGQVDGTVYLEEDGRRHSFPGIQLELLGADGKRAAEARAAFDGFFSFEGIKPGTYSLRVPPGELERLGLEGGYRRSIQIEPTGTIIEGMDLVLRPKGP